MSNQLVGIRELSEYAEDPRSFLKNRGKVRNKAAADYGIKMHDSLGKSTNIVVTVFRAIGITFIFILLGIFTYSLLG